MSLVIDKDKELLEKYNTLLSEQKEFIKQQCFDFSQIPAINKRNLNIFLNNVKCSSGWCLTYTNNNKVLDNIVLDNFLILKGIVILNSIKQERHRSKTKLSKSDYDKERCLAHFISDNDKAYVYSTKHARELLYLCSKYKIDDNTTLLDKIVITINTEKVKLDVKAVNINNIKFIVNNIPIDYICLDVDLSMS